MKQELIAKGKKLLKDGIKWFTVFLIVSLTVIVLVQRKKIVEPPIVLPDPGPAPIVVTPSTEVTVATIREVIAPASDLISYKYYYTDAGLWEKDKKFLKLPVGSEKTVYIYTGEIGVGFDLDKVDFDLDDSNKTLLITLPALEVMTHELDHDSFEYYDIKKSILVEFTLEDFNEFQKTLMDEQEAKLLEKDVFLVNAKKNSEGIISSLLMSCGQLEEYTITYQWAE